MSAEPAWITTDQEREIWNLVALVPPAWRRLFLERLTVFIQRLQTLAAYGPAAAPRVQRYLDALHAAPSEPTRPYGARARRRWKRDLARHWEQFHGEEGRRQDRQGHA